MEKKNQYDSLETLHGTFQTTLSKKYLERKPWKPENLKQIKSAIPGTVLQINVQQGQSVKAGDLLIIFRAMKMDNRIKAPMDGIIQSISVTEGENVRSHTVMIELE